jgi:hypothetical protein
VKQTPLLHVHRRVIQQLLFLNPFYIINSQGFEKKLKDRAVWTKWKRQNGIERSWFHSKEIIRRFLTALSTKRYGREI